MRIALTSEQLYEVLLPHKTQEFLLQVSLAVIQPKASLFATPLPI